MNDKFQERLKEIAKECGGNRALCEKSGVSERTFANWLSGSSEPKIIGISDIANAAGITIDWLVTGVQPKYRLGPRPDYAEETIQIALIDNQLKENQGSLSQSFLLQGHLPFSTPFLKTTLGIEDFANLCLLKACGDSMEPTIANGDLVLIDRSRTAAIDGLAAYAFKGSILIKRFIYLPDGTVDMINDNQSLYPAHRLNQKDLQDLQMIGSVVWVGRTVSG